MADQIKTEIQAALQNNNQALAAEMAVQYLQMLKTVHLNIAITGEVKAGKSTLVNALRGIRNHTAGAAPTGVMETTMEPTEYIHPQNNNIRIWDLPGIGTVKFTSDEYVKKMKFEEYDFFIIVSNLCFKENDAKLAKEIQRMGKKFYFVRSRIDGSIRDEKDCNPDLNEENLLNDIRNKCTEELLKLGIESPKVFLVSGLRLHLYEFKDLWETLEKELPERQRDVLLLALPNISLSVIEQKKNALWYKMIWYTLGSAAGAAFVEVVSVPGLSVDINVSAVLEFTTECRASLGLTPEALQKLSFVTDVSLAELREELRSPLASHDPVTRDHVVSVLSMSAHHIASEAIEKGARLVPVFGIPVAVGLSTFTMYKALGYVLNALAEDAQRVFVKALGENASV